MKFRRGPATRGPTSSIGIMQFFDADTKGPKLTPELIVVLAFLFAIIILGLQLIS